MRRLLLFLLLLPALAGCADDPIIGPNEGGTGGGGSYGVLHFRAAPSDTAGTPAEAALPANPERF